MNAIKNIHLLAGIVANVEDLEAGAALYKRHGNIEFKVITADESACELVVLARQGKNQAEKYLDPKELIERARSLFLRFLPGWKLLVRASVYNPHPSQQVTPQWITERLQARGWRLKDLINAVGLDKSNVSAWVGGLRPMSNIVKSLMWHVLK